MRLAFHIRHASKIFFLYLYTFQYLKLAKSLDDIRYIPDEEFEQMLHVQHHLQPHRSKRLVTLDYGSGTLTEATRESTMTITLVWIDPTSAATGTLMTSTIDDLPSIETTGTKLTTVTMNTIMMTSDPCARSSQTPYESSSYVTSTTERIEDTSSIPVWRSEMSTESTSIDPCFGSFSSSSYTSESSSTSTSTETIPHFTTTTMTTTEAGESQTLNTGSSTTTITVVPSTSRTTQIILTSIASSSIPTDFVPFTDTSTRETFTHTQLSSTNSQHTGDSTLTSIITNTIDITFIPSTYTLSYSEHSTAQTFTNTATGVNPTTSLHTELTLGTTSLTDTTATTATETTTTFTYTESNVTDITATILTDTSIATLDTSTSTITTTDATSTIRSSSVIFTITKETTTRYINTTVSTMITTLLTTHSTTLTTNITTKTTVNTLSTTTARPQCDRSQEVEVENGRCVKYNELQIESYQNLKKHSNDTNLVVRHLSQYIHALTGSTIIGDSNSSLLLGEIDEIIKHLSGDNVTRNSFKSFIMVIKPPSDNNTLALGASFMLNSGGTRMDFSNETTFTNSNDTVAAIIQSGSSHNIKSINMLIIGESRSFEKREADPNKTIGSSIVVAGLTQHNESNQASINISLYFSLLNSVEINPFVKYHCSYWNTKNRHWNESGCTLTRRNKKFECVCNHLTAFALLWSPIVCNDTNQIPSINGTCTDKEQARDEAVDQIRKNTTNGTGIANALSVYISSLTEVDTSAEPPGKVLTIENIDAALEKIDVTLEISKSDCYIMAQPPSMSGEEYIIGASFTRGQGGQIVKNVDEGQTLQSNISAAAIIQQNSLDKIASINILIIVEPTAFEKIDNTTNKTLASSIIVANIIEKNESNQAINTTITLYFQVLDEYKPNLTDIYYFCSYYDTVNFTWQEDGCTPAIYNETYRRYSCTCNHLTSFALLWLPRRPFTNGTRDSLDKKDIASLVFQSISILCFLLIIIHSIIFKMLYPNRSLEARDLLPLISFVVTTILFIFYIALGLTVYQQELDLSVTECFLSAKVLMFFVYFFLILMLCTKTSIGYFNYLRFVILFPEPSKRRLATLLIISFFISIIWVSFAAGFDSNPSFHITQIHYGKICWFSGNNLYYFVTIPVGIFLILNFLLIIMVANRIIDHVRHATSPDQTYERMKRCVIILLASCMTQGLGWLFGPFISFVHPTDGNVLEWFFIVFNGLEGFWIILLYCLIRLQRLDEHRRETASKDLSKNRTKSTSLIKKKSIKLFYLDRVDDDIRSSEC